MEPLLRLNFLGPPEVLYEDRGIKFSTRKALALFTYLVINTGLQPREKLQAIFWPESKSSLAQSALRNTLVRIRGDFKRICEPLRMEQGLVGFNEATSYQLDLDLITHALEAAQGNPNSSASISVLQMAIDTARGPFLEAFSLPDSPIFNDWILMQRHTYEERLNTIHDWVSLYYLEMHLFQSAIETVNRWLKLDRVNEKAYGRLMHINFLNGNRSRAMQIYQICSNVLADHLGIEPSPETEALVAQIRSRQVTIPAPDAYAGSLKDCLRRPFIGLSEEFQALVGAYHKLKNGTPQIVFVTGEAGIGKTRLVDEFLNWAYTQNADILHARAYEIGERLPYQPVVDALRERLERENAPEDLLDDVWLVELTRILPELRERYPDLAQPLCEDSTTKSTLFEAIARLGTSLSTNRPLVLQIDAMKWDDADTLGLLNYLFRSWSNKRNAVLLVMIIRKEALSDDTAIQEVINGFASEFPVTHLVLPPMTITNIQEFVQSASGENAAGIAEFSEWLYGESRGIPGIMFKVLSTLEKNGKLSFTGESCNSSLLDPAASLANLLSPADRNQTPAVKS